MNKTTEQTTKLRNLICFSPHVTDAQLVHPDTILCRFELIAEDLLIEIDSDGIAHLVTVADRSYLNLALGPIEDYRVILRSLDYFLMGFEEPHFLVG